MIILVPMSRVGPKGQVVLPKPVRDALGISVGDRVVVDVEDGKAVLIPVRSRSASDLLGVLRTPHTVDLHRARGDYQDHLIEKFSRDLPNA